MDLLAFERKLDQTIARKRMEIQEAIKKPIMVLFHDNALSDFQIMKGYFDIPFRLYEVLPNRKFNIIILKIPVLFIWVLMVTGGNSKVLFNKTVVVQYVFTIKATPYIIS